MLNEATSKALNRVAKWRSVFAGWQLGTRTKEDPESQAVRNHREGTIMLRVELSALTQLLVKRGVFTREEVEDQLQIEAMFLDKKFEQCFPGFRSTDEGMSIDPKVAAETMKGWRP